MVLVYLDLAQVSRLMQCLDSGEFDSRAVQQDSWIYVSGDGFGRIVEVRRPRGLLLHSLTKVVWVVGARFLVTAMVRPNMARRH